MPHQTLEYDQCRGARGRGITFHSLPSVDRTVNDPSEGYGPASPDPFHTQRNNTHACIEAGVRREKSEALLNDDWRHNRRPRAETEAVLLNADLRRANGSFRPQPRIESDILTCERIKDTPVDPNMINSAPVVGMLQRVPDEHNGEHDQEEAPIRLCIDSLRESGHEVISHMPSTDGAGQLDEIPDAEVFPSFAVKPFDGTQQDSDGSSCYCLLRKNSVLQRFKARDWNNFAEEEWETLSSAFSTTQSHLPSAFRCKDGQKGRKVTDQDVRADSPIKRKRTADTETRSDGQSEEDVRYKVCILDKLHKKSTPGTSSISSFHGLSEAAVGDNHGETQRHRRHFVSSDTGSAAVMNAAKNFKWNPNAPEFATHPPSKPPPATITHSGPSRSRPPLIGAFDPTLMTGGFDPTPITGGFDPVPMTGDLDHALLMGGFDPTIQRGAFDPRTDYCQPVTDHVEGTIAETCARLRKMLYDLEVTAANQAERDRYLNGLSKMLLPGAAQKIPGLKTRPAAYGVFAPGTTMPFVNTNSQLCSEPGAVMLPTFTAPIGNGAGAPPPSVGPNSPFHAAPLPAPAGMAPDICPKGPVPTVSSFGPSNPVRGMPTLQPNESLSGLPQHNGTHQSNTFPSRRARGAASDPVPFHPIFGPKPVEKPKGPPRPHDPLWNRQQQMYEAWLEWQRSINPARHLEGKERQNKRNERRIGSRRSESESAMGAEIDKPRA